MGIKVKISPYLKQYTDDQQVIYLDASTVAQCLNRLVERFPALRKWFARTGNAFDYITVHLNAMGIYPKELSRRLKDGDESTILVPYPGG